jgi:hypothetical protein
LPAHPFLIIVSLFFVLFCFLQLEQEKVDVYIASRRVKQHLIQHFDLVFGLQRSDRLIAF